MLPTEQEEYKDKLFREEWDRYYKTPGSIKQSLLSVMTDSEIASIIWDKRREWGLIEWEKKARIKWLRWDRRELVEFLFLSKQELIDKLIKELQYVLRSRQVWWWDNVDLQKAKESISIIEVIEVVAWIKISNSYKLIRCPLHDDSTASLKIYKNTNTFYCQWCHLGGSQIDFIKHFYKCTVREAIQKFLTFYSK